MSKKQYYKIHVVCRSSQEKASISLVIVQLKSPKADVTGWGGARSAPYAPLGMGSPQYIALTVSTLSISKQNE